MYHERQRLQFCALHALNNLFQASVFAKQDLDDICNSLNSHAKLNPHKSIFGLGNYDVNVLSAALELKHYQLIWFDKRKNLNSINLFHVFGFVINKLYKPNVFGLPIPLNRRHWLAVRYINGRYYNLDSKLSQPECIGNEDSLIDFLANEISVPTTEMFLVVSNALDKNSWWKMDK